MDPPDPVGNGPSTNLLDEAYDCVIELIWGVKGAFVPELWGTGSMVA